MGCYSFGVPAGTVSLVILGGPGPVGTTGYGSQEKLLGGFSRLTKNPGCFLFMYNPLIGMYCRLGIYRLLRCWCTLQLYPMRGRFERYHRLFFLILS